MQKEVKYKGNVDYPATLASLDAVGVYVVIPTSDTDISAIRTAVAKYSKQPEAAGKTYSVHKTKNGARIQRDA